MKIEYAHNGRALVEADKNQSISPSSVQILSWPSVDLIQINNGEKFLPEYQLSKINDSYTFSFGNYDVTVTKRRTGGRVDPKILSLALAKQKRKMSRDK